MTFDRVKRQANQEKHKIDLAECESVFDESMLTRKDGSEIYGEQRLVSLAWLKGQVVVLVWVDREDGPRLISCRKAQTYERQAYFRAFSPG